MVTTRQRLTHGRAGPWGTNDSAIAGGNPLAYPDDDVPLTMNDGSMIGNLKPAGGTLVTVDPYTQNSTVNTLATDEDGNFYYPTRGKGHVVPAGRLMRGIPQ